MIGQNAPIDPVDRYVQTLARLDTRLGDVERRPSSGGEVTPPPPTITSYVHNQDTASAVWTITHNLGWYPNVAVIDSGGTNVEGDITQINTTSMRLTFSAAFAGIAYLS